MVEEEEGGKTQPHPNTWFSTHYYLGWAKMFMQIQLLSLIQFTKRQSHHGRPPSRRLSALLDDVSMTLFILSQRFFLGAGAAASIAAEIDRRTEKEISKQTRR